MYVCACHLGMDLGNCRLGFMNLKSDMEMIMGKRGLFQVLYYPYWLPMWTFFTPALLIVSPSPATQCGYALKAAVLTYTDKHTRLCD